MLLDLLRGKFSLQSDDRRNDVNNGLHMDMGLTSKNVPANIIEFAMDKKSAAGYCGSAAISRLWKWHCGKRMWWVTAWKYAFGHSYYVCSVCKKYDGPYHCSPTDGVLR